jgi:hypothetical protein
MYVGRTEVAVNPVFKELQEPLLREADSSKWKVPPPEINEH